MSAKNQTDDAWDRPLHLVEREFPELWQQAPSPESARQEVLARLLASQVFATTSELVDGSGLGKRAATAAIESMAGAQRLEVAMMDEQVGWRLAQEEAVGADGPGIVQVLHLRDPLVRPQLDDLAQRFKGREVLQYLLIDDVAGDAMSAHE